MNEAEWLDATDPMPMLEHLRGKVSDRKRYLFACACWRWVLADWRFAPMISLIETYEKFADGLATDYDLKAGSGDAPTVLVVLNVEMTIRLARTAAAVGRSLSAPVSMSWGQLVLQAFSSPSPGFSADATDTQAQADLMRHIFGNPFRPLAPGEFSTAIVRLAEAGYAGEDYAFALHDALLESGHAELAEHFQDAAHPRGCWALDHILGKS